MATASGESLPSPVTRPMVGRGGRDRRDLHGGAGHERGEASRCRLIAGSLSSSYDEGTWVLTSYLVANAIIIPVSGWIAPIMGRKRFLMLCVALFTLSSAMCGMADSLGMLVFCRVLQGLGGGGLQPCVQAVLVDLFPGEKTRHGDGLLRHRHPSWRRCSARR